jgi:hypothetical protein
LVVVSISLILFNVINVINVINYYKSK